MLNEKSGVSLIKQLLGQDECSNVTDNDSDHQDKELGCSGPQDRVRRPPKIQIENSDSYP